MFNSFKKLSILHILPRCIAAVVAAVLLLAISGFGVFSLILGPTELETCPEDELVGRYIRFDSTNVVYGYASSSNSNGDPVAHSYIISLGDKYLSAFVDADESESFEAAGEAFYAWFSGEAESIPSYGSFTGEVREADPELVEMLTGWLVEAELAADEAEAASLIIPADIYVNDIGGMSYTLIWILSAAAVLLIAYAVFELVRALSGQHQRAAKAAVSDMAESAVEADYASAQTIDLVHLGDKFLWYQDGARTRVIKTQDILWLFSHVDPALSGKRKNLLSIYLTDRSGLTVRMLKPEQRTELIEAVRAKGVRFVEGYSYKLATTFETDSKAFLKLAGRTEVK